MFPLRDVHPPQRPPLITRLLIVLNVLAFLVQIVFSWGAHWLGGANLAAVWGVRPVCYFSPGSCGLALSQAGGWLWQPLLVSLFLHGGVLHLAFNMLFLWVFGPRVEERLGRFAFTLAYLGGGVVASLAFVVTHPLTAAPLIGASGAIAAVLGLYFILLPKSWILTYFPPIFLFPLPAPLFLLIWILGQFAGVWDQLPFLSPAPQHAPDNIAWMAHLGGFFFGAFWGWQVQPWRKRNGS